MTDGSGAGAVRGRAAFVTPGHSADEPAASGTCALPNGSSPDWCFHDPPIPNRTSASATTR